MNRASKAPEKRQRDGLSGWLERNKLNKKQFYPQFRNWHFWMIQVLVIYIAGMHAILETGDMFQDWRVPFVMPTGLFLVPVVYAALTFGLSGALITALWAGFLTIPNAILWYGGMERWGEAFQILIVIVVAFFVGREVDRVKSARQEAESAANELKASRMRYRSLFESSPIAVLVLDPNSNIIEANPAAALLFGADKATMERQSIADLLGGVNMRKVLGIPPGGGWRGEPLTVKLKEGEERYLEPLTNELSDGQGNIITEVLLRDVTEEHGRQTGLKAYTAYVTRAQEEERQRISRELHDQTIQSLVLLYRRLDSVLDLGDSIPSGVRDHLQEARRLAEEIVMELRDFTRALRPPVLDDLGLVTSTRRLLTDFTERTGISGEFKVSGKERRLTSDAELSLFRIAQEALWNVEYHAQATHVDMKINFTGNEVMLEVTDNGIGFNLSSSSSDMTATGHLGLISMQERAALLGGKLTIRSGPAQGTSVTASAPFIDNGPETR